MWIQSSESALDYRLPAFLPKCQLLAGDTCCCGTGVGGKQTSTFRSHIPDSLFFSLGSDIPQALLNAPSNIKSPTSLSFLAASAYARVTRPGFKLSVVLWSSPLHSTLPPSSQGWDSGFSNQTAQTQVPVGFVESSAPPRTPPLKR